MIVKWIKNKRNDKKSSLYENELIRKCSVFYISCDSIRSNSMRSRCDFDEGKLISLAYSIKRYGIIEPLCVRKTDVDDSYDYELISGERRLRAAKLAGYNSVPCIISNAEQGISAELSIVENIYSESLNYFEVAVALQRIVEYYDGSFDDLASRLSIPQNELSKKLLLLELDYNERQALLASNIKEDIAVSIARISDKEERKAIIDMIYAEKGDENAMLSILNDFASKKYYTDASFEIPRDISAVIKGIKSKLRILNRTKKRAEMTIRHTNDHIVAEIKIKR